MHTNVFVASDGLEAPAFPEVISVDQRATARSKQLNKKKEGVKFW